ncbi:MAG: hypothetical protein F2667_11575 [Actinobacteria bacterium]|uniref:Unannotated protein n=1 Tax=freshwater metagenome TaxID=449393 RepID=A0A6J6RQ28_9ZZZZ|nr:hypothetical protein [Actinomycetota bacterium]
MRIQRIVSLFVALFMIAGLTAALGSSSATAVAAKAKEDRQIEVSGKEPRPNKFFIKGRVTPTTGKTKAVVQKKNCASKKCGWFNDKLVKTNDKGRFTVRVFGPARGQQKVYYRVKTSPTAKYQGATSITLVIRRL